MARNEDTADALDAIAKRLDIAAKRTAAAVDKMRRKKLPSVLANGTKMALSGIAPDLAASEKSGAFSFSDLNLGRPALTRLKLNRPALTGLELQGAGLTGLEREAGSARAD